MVRWINCRDLILISHMCVVLFILSTEQYSRVSWAPSARKRAP